MTRLPTLTARKLIQALLKAGFVVQRQRGSHVFLKHPERSLRTCVPMHGGEDLDRSLMRLILRQAGLSEDEFLSLI